ncbi:hypothetical protein GFL39_05670 [Rhizobium leguminosarum bv. viciae]|nr:hypothetical protein [Rhizobium leguminosarum bv. viciae]NKL85638.1 hypothetical protein [Rhizobium leguminosarum bv. viciae]NKL89620.1 hypothetical protein [Rhizobium leguminosarum bv. viciae]NKM90587.1 hypothetical protein [Rhizobium leguminosarum bv. viciae]
MQGGIPALVHRHVPIGLPLSLCFYAIPDAKPLHTFAGIALIRMPGQEKLFFRQPAIHSWQPENAGRWRRA